MQDHRKHRQGQDGREPGNKQIDIGNAGHPLRLVLGGLVCRDVVAHRKLLVEHRVDTNQVGEEEAWDSCDEEDEGTGGQSRAEDGDKITPWGTRVLLRRSFGVHLTYHSW